MDVEREDLLRYGVPVAAVIVFTALVVGVGLLYGGTSLSEVGALALVAAMVVFIVGMAIAGVLITRFEE